MTQDQFLYWLKGYTEDKTRLNDQEWSRVKEELDKITFFPNIAPIWPEVSDRAILPYLPPAPIALTNVIYPPFTIT